MLNNESKIQIGEVLKLSDLPDDERIKKLVEEGEMTVPQALIELSKADAEFFISENSEVYASLQIKHSYENYLVNSEKFKKYLRGRYYYLFNKTLSNSQLSEAIETIIAIEEFNSQSYHETFIRVGGDYNSIYLDLCTPNNDIVEINRDSWTIKKTSPIKFTRPRTIHSLPIPIKGGKISNIDRFINIKDEDKILVYSFLLSCLIPTGPYPILIVQGSQGSGKSFFCKLLKNLVDPVFAPIRSLPRNEEDLVITAQKNRLLAFDNLSGLKNSMSDAFCKLATGGGFSTRKFFENKEEVVFSTLRPLILNGIDYIARRPDLADRSIIINLEPIRKKERKSEEELLQEIELIKPKILGSLLDALSIALKEYENVNLEAPPRMADFSKWATAAETGFGFERGTFIKAYEKNQLETAQEAVEHDIVISTIIDCLKKEKGISGNASYILAKLENYLTIDPKRTKDWVTSPNQLKNILIRIQPILEANHITYNYERNNNGRIHTLEIYDE